MPINTYYDKPTYSPMGPKSGAPQGGPGTVQRPGSPTASNPGPAGDPPVSGPGGYTYNGATNSWNPPQTVHTVGAPMGYPGMGGPMQGLFGGYGQNSGPQSNFNPYATFGEVGAPTAPGTIQPPANIARIGAGGQMGNVGHISDINTDAKNAALFGRAKDQVGLSARGAVTGLAGVMAGRGILGSGVEGRGIASAINAGQGQLGDVSRENAIQDANMAEQNAIENYRGDVTQRGQTMSSLDTQRGQDVTQRGQDVSSAQNAYNNLTAQRGQDVGLQEAGYAGKINQRGQNINQQGQQGNFNLDQQRINQQHQQAAFDALMRLYHY